MITASIVLYRTNMAQLETAIKSYSPRENRLLFLVDNSPERTVMPPALSGGSIEYIFTGENVGYGTGHNIAIKKALALGSDYHVVLNPDTRFEPDVIDGLEKFMDENQDCGHVMPKILNPDGEIQHLCKLIPSPVDLIFKRFFLGKIQNRLSYKFRLDFADYNEQMEAPYLSGCFMFFRTAALQDVGLFDERFFMYPEDIDITRRIHAKWRTVYYPKVSIYHEHAAESYKSRRMLKIHVQNMIRYFNKWGWIFDKERRAVNTKILSQLGWGKTGRRIK